MQDRKLKRNDRLVERAAAGHGDPRLRRRDPKFLPGKEARGGDRRVPQDEQQCQQASTYGSEAAFAFHTGPELAQVSARPESPHPLVGQSLLHQKQLHGSPGLQGDRDRHPKGGELLGHYVLRSIRQTIPR